jgi:hypothetical protein
MLTSEERWGREGSNRLERMSDPEGASPPSTRRPKPERHLSLTRRRAREEKAADDSRAYAEWIKAVLRLATQLVSKHVLFSTEL